MRTPFRQYQHRAMVIPAARNHTLFRVDIYLLSRGSSVTHCPFLCQVVTSCFWRSHPLSGDLIPCLAVTLCVWGSPSASDCHILITVSGSLLLRRAVTFCVGLPAAVSGSTLVGSRSPASGNRATNPLPNWAASRLAARHDSQPAGETVCPPCSRRGTERAAAALSTQLGCIHAGCLLTSAGI